MTFRRTLTSQVSAKHDQHYQKQKIVTRHGMARLIGPDTVSVNGQELKARYIVIATGAALCRLWHSGQGSRYHQRIIP
jgi:glutathione reductase (NADPH)